MLEVLMILFIIIAAFFILTFGIYYFNLDMKFVRRVYDLLSKHYDHLEKDRKL